jgi:hypothetical protein
MVDATPPEKPQRFVVSEHVFHKGAFQVYDAVWQRLLWEGTEGECRVYAASLNVHNLPEKT